MIATSRRPRVGSPLFWRLFLSSAVIVATVLAVALLTLAASASRTADTAVARALTETQRLVTALLDARERALTSASLVFAQNPQFRALVLEQRPEDLLDQSVEATQRTGASWVQITNDQGVRLAKSDEPGALPLELGGTALVGGALQGEPVAGAGIAGDSVLFQGVAVPIVGATAVAGVLMSALAIDGELAREIEQATASDILFFLYEHDGAPRIVASTLPVDGDLQRFTGEYADALYVAAPGDTAARRVSTSIGGTEFVGEGALLRSSGGEPLGGFVALRSRDEEMAPFTALRRRIVLAGGAGLLLACLLSFVLARGITRPILDMAEMTRRATAGDFAAHALRTGGDDELGVLANAMREMFSGLREREALASIAREIPPAPPVAPSDALLAAGGFAPGAVVAARYRIMYPIGAGGSGVVYKAVDDELGEPVAIKTLRRDLLAENDGVSLERLRSEIRLARRITHVNVVRIHDIGEADGIRFVTMEFISGTPLDRLIESRGALPPAGVLAVGRQLCRALQVAHEQGIIHRDIKPQNLMVQPDGVLKVMDFGIARLVTRSTTLTAEGAVVGTPAYMAPEQLLGEEVDERADIYAAGVVLYECATGRRPIDAGTPAALIGRLLTETAPDARTVSQAISPALSALIARAMSRDREQRPRSAAVMLEELVGLDLGEG